MPCIGILYPLEMISYCSHLTETNESNGGDSVQKTSEAAGIT